MRFIEDFNLSIINVSADIQIAIGNWIEIMHHQNKFSSPISETIVHVDEDHNCFVVKTECYLTGEIFEFEAWRVQEGDHGFSANINGIYAEY